MIIGNPEFHRNIWLRFSPWRLIAMPVLIFLSLAVFGGFTGSWWIGVSPVAQSMFYIVVFLWGIYEAAKAPVAELRDKTWDFQKMSSLGAWELTLGKLFGATSYVWYFGLTLLGVFVLAKYNALTHQEVSGLAVIAPTVKAPFSSVLFSAFVMAVSGLIGQATAFFLGLYHLKLSRFSVIRSFIAGLITAHLAMSTAKMHEFPGVFGQAEQITGWLGMHISSETFIIASLIFILSWLLVGNQRLMRMEIGYRNRPIAWGLFVASFAVYLAGAAGGAPFEPEKGYITAFFFALFCAYGVMMNEAHDLTMYRKFWYGWQRGQTQNWQENLPKWTVAAALTLAAIPFVMIGAGETEHRGDILIFLICICLFALRDGFMIHAFLLKPGSRYGYFTTAVFWILVYVLLPLFFVGDHVGNIFEDVASIDDKAQSMRMTASFFYPVASAKNPGYLLPILAELALAFVFLRYQLQKIANIDAPQAMAKPKSPAA